jgi:hypothetical protein
VFSFHQLESERIQGTLGTAGSTRGQAEEPPQEANHVHIDEWFGVAVHDR